VDGTRFELNGLLVVIKGVVLNVKRCGWRGRPAGLWLKGINLAKAKKEDLEQHDRSTAHQKIAMTQREEDNRAGCGVETVRSQKSVKQTWTVLLLLHTSPNNARVAARSRAQTPLHLQYSK
jgi:hypothetical protein